MKNRVRMLTLTCAALACGQAMAQTPSASPAPGPAQAQVDATFAAWDSDRNSSLSQQEFRNGWAGMERRLMAQSLQAQFNQIDVNKNGAIDASEYGNLVLVRRAGKAAPSLATFDTNKDQRLQFQEYVGLVGRLTPKR